MNTGAEKENHFRFSLRGLLIALLVLGAGLGLLGRLFRQNPDIFKVVVETLSTIVAYALAVGTIIWIGAKRRQWGMLAWGISLVFIPFLGFGVIALTQRFVVTSPGSLGVQSTTQLIDQQLPKQLDAPWVWRELEKRAGAGSLSQEEAEAAVGVLIAHMKATKPEGWDQPLSWQRDFLASVRQKGLLSDAVTFELCDAFYGPEPIVQPLPRVREGTSQFDMDIEYGNAWSDHTGINLSLLWHVDRVLLDGSPIKVEQRYYNADRGRWGGTHNGTVPVGDHEITFEMTFAYVDKAKLIGLEMAQLSPTRWPNVAKQWKRKISVPFRVFTVDEPLVRLTTDANLDPRSGINIKRCVVQAGTKNKKKVIVELALDAAVSMSFDVSIELAGTNIPLGARWIARRDRGSVSGGGTLTAVIETLDPVIELADIILTPAPEHVEHRSEVTEIWGKPITIYSVPVERLDLEVSPEGE